MDGKVIRSHTPAEAALETNRKAGILGKEQFAQGQRYAPSILCSQKKNQQKSEEAWLSSLEQADSQAGEEARSAINYGYCFQTDQAIHSHTNEIIRSCLGSQKDSLLPVQNDQKGEEIEEPKRRYQS